MKLSECNIGRIIIMKQAHKLEFRSEVGHIVGLTANPIGEVIPLVLFACEKESVGVHHGLMDPLEDKNTSNIANEAKTIISELAKYSELIWESPIFKDGYKNVRSDLIVRASLFAKKHL